MLTIKCNTDAIINRTLGKFKQIQHGGTAYESGLREAIQGELKAAVQRIHVDGRAGDGSDIGQYATTPMYINPKNSPQSFGAEGKTGKTTFAKTGQPHVTKYFDQGYKDFRQAIGLSSDKVVLVLSGDLRDRLTVIPTATGYGIGWPEQPLYDLSQVLEKKYDKPIWSATKEEHTEMVHGFALKVAEALK